jgi:hypothetical protein
MGVLPAAVMATSIGDNIDSAREFWVSAVTRTAEARFWSPDELADALIDVDEAYNDVTGFESLAYKIGGFFGSASSGELQVLTFTSALAERAKNWTAPGGAELQATLAGAVQQNVDQAERTTSTFTDELEDAGEATKKTLADIPKVTTDPTNWVFVGAAAVVVLFIFARVR